jgi:hypothetical protein
MKEPSISKTFSANPKKDFSTDHKGETHTIINECAGAPDRKLGGEFSAR